MTLRVPEFRPVTVPCSMDDIPNPGSKAMLILPMTAVFGDEKETVCVHTADTKVLPSVSLTLLSAAHLPERGRIVDTERIKTEKISFFIFYLVYNLSKYP